MFTVSTGCYKYCDEWAVLPTSLVAEATLMMLVLRVVVMLVLLRIVMLLMLLMLGMLEMLLLALLHGSPRPTECIGGLTACLGFLQ